MSKPTRSIYTVPNADNGSENVPKYSLEESYDRLCKNRNIIPIYHEKRLYDLIVELGVAREKAESIQAVATVNYLAMERGEVNPSLVKTLMLTLAAMGYDAADRVSMAQENVRLDFNESMDGEVQS